ncbi:MAG: hypothetical protein Q7T20_08895 [Saprospiraceae bacterium]|nr:hypothetical protein [Saprospiraceae bacterium]
MQEIENCSKEMLNCKKWLHSTLFTPYSIEQMTETLERYLNLHFWYYSISEHIQPEKRQRIRKISKRFVLNFFIQTRNFYTAFAASENNMAFVRSEIARLEYPFLFYQQGRYYNNGFEAVIPQAIDLLAEDRDPFFELVFDENIDFSNVGPSEDIFNFYSDIYYLQFLRGVWKNIEAYLVGESNEPPVAYAGNIIAHRYDSFISLFKRTEDFDQVVLYLKSIDILDENAAFITGSGKKKYLAVLVQALQKKGKLKPVYNYEIARLMTMQFKIDSLSPDYISKDFPKRRDLLEEVMKDLVL